MIYLLIYLLCMVLNCIYIPSMAQQGGFGAPSRANPLQAPRLMNVRPAPAAPKRVYPAAPTVPIPASAPIVPPRVITPPEPQAPPVAPPAPVAPPIAEPTAPKKITVKTRDWGPRYAEVSDLFARVQTDRQELENVRQQGTQKYQEASKEAAPNYIKVIDFTNQGNIDYLVKRMEETIKKLGPPPTQFAIFTMGSIARGESGLITDLEIGILVKEKTVESQKYFERFVQILADRLFLLGEHPDVGGKGLRMDEADNSPLHLKFFARYADEKHAKELLLEALEKKDMENLPYEGSRLLIATPEDLADYIRADYLKEANERDKREEKKIFDQELKKALADPKNKGKTKAELMDKINKYIRLQFQTLSLRERRFINSLSDLMRNMKFLYGDKNLFDKFIKLRDQNLLGVPKQQNNNYSNRRQEIAYLAMRDDMLKHIQNPKSPVAAGTLFDEIDLKREVYRFAEQILTDLGFFYNVGTQNTIEIAKKLVEMGIMNKDLADALTDHLNYSFGLRLKKQSLMKKQGYALPVTKEKFDEIKEDLETEQKHLELVKELLVSSEAEASKIAEIDSKISKAKTNLKELNKIVPGEAESILSPDVIGQLKTKYLPLLKRLFEDAKDFLAGNKKAFLEEKYKPSASPAQ